MTMAAMDLAAEAEILSSIEPHVNIIHLYGISSVGLTEAQNDNGMGFFILVDILAETLRDRLLHWRRKLEYQQQEQQEQDSDNQSRNSFSPQANNNP